ncbi:hypothetical protein N7474_003059 [Penicillium riverlandense]|uniref:uncharacterized protein n=1 Tax=Penicillium riverlandense TaxID=1903569 RepID=UPI002546F5FE|nr:uncharacterized protein N7474_003059 [Penicillium riverlandense]KAJ5825921.1 hypothetical protein N7474_003059 [Penicillium riverlandense]
MLQSKTKFVDGDGGVLVQATVEGKSFPEKNRNHIPKEGTVEETSSARESLANITCVGAELPKLGPIDRVSILTSLISNVGAKTRERYSYALDTYDIANILDESLNPVVKVICVEGRFDLDSLIKIGQEPETSADGGIYLHILWKESERTTFWLYIGQASKFCDRIQKHNDPRFRHRNPSLHYKVWDSAKEMKSKFVILATLTPPECPQTQLIFNLGEMWLCLVFQTLPELQMGQWLPEDVKTLWSGHHLNVALPLWQGFTNTTENQAIREATGGRIAFQQYLLSEDSLVREWAEHARDAFNDVRNSPNPIIRKYWWELYQQRRLKSQETWGTKKADRAKELLAGAKATVKVSHHGEMTEVMGGMFRFTVARSLGLHLRHGDEVTLQYHMAATRHPHPYANKSLPTDPACRLGISIRGRDMNGEFQRWLHTNGELNVRKMNSLVDVLEGYSLGEIKEFKRRWHVNKSRVEVNEKTLRRHVYT